MSLIKRLLLVIRRGLVFFFRRIGVLSKDTYTKKYIRILQKQGCDISDFNTCGYIAPSVYFDSYDRSKIHIGANAYLTHDVIFLVHDQSVVTSYNGVPEVRQGSSLNCGDMYAPRDVYVGDNVFIGMRTIVLPGSKIGDNVILGAGSVVSGNIPSNTVWAGNPAKMIRSIENHAERLAMHGMFESDLQ